MKKEKIRAELLDEILGGARTQAEIFGPGGILKTLSGALVERVLKAELAAHLDQEREEQATPANRHNGVSKKLLQTENGPVEIEIPRDRQATFEPIILPKHSKRIAGLDDKILSLYARGLSTRDIQRELAELYGTEISPMLISRVTEAVYEEISEWKSRPLESVYAVVWLDALMVKMRDQGVVQNRAVHVAVGMTRDGLKKVLGMWVETNEGAKFWMRVLAELRERGVKDILFACCDGLKGFPAAIEAVFPQAIVQTCVVHQVRYSLSYVGYKERPEIVAGLRMIYCAPSENTAIDALKTFEKKHGERYPMIVKSWRENWDRIVPFLGFPQEIRKLIYTTNAIESLNYQFRKVIRSKGHFPNEDAAIKLLYLALRNAERNWKAAP
ncbi:MAG: IS256 family transposase, partial [Deltaproteobacteria bacterium]|nr:IS256 family transposase [Deltaproteobacteria bacterium]